MKKPFKIFLIFYFLLILIGLAGIFFTNKKEGLEEKVLLAFIAQGVSGEEMECLKARAILIRTNLVANEAMVELATPQELDDWIKDDVTGDNYDSLKSAIKQTKGMIQVYNGNVTYLPYHGISCGMTRDTGEITKEECAYIKSASCKGDILAKNYIEVRKYSAEEFSGELEILERFETGYVKSIKVGETIYSGEEFRKMYNLPSACFFVEKIDSGIRILTKGQGHGLGMSLNMANELAKNGSSATEILNYFFLGLSPALYEQGEICPY